MPSAIARPRRRRNGPAGLLLLSVPLVLIAVVASIAEAQPAEPAASDAHAPPAGAADSEPNAAAATPARPAAVLIGPVPNPVEATQPDKLAAGIVQELAKQLGRGYHAQTDSDRRLVFFSAADRRTTRRVRRRVTAFHDALSEELFDRPLVHPIAVVLATVSDFKRLGLPASASGMYSDPHRALVTVSLGRVIEHEMVHALHASDQRTWGQAHATWVKEGLATLFQEAPVEQGRLRPRARRDLSDFQQALAADKIPSLTELSRMSKAEFYAEGKTLRYSQARYLMLYLHRRGQLRAFYHAYRDSYPSDPTGLSALTSTLGGDLETAEADWRGWVAALDQPWQRGRGRAAWLGIRMRPGEGGIEVAELIPRGPAKRAQRLRVGDVIVSVAGRPTPDADALRKALSGHQPGQTVAIEVRRDGRTVTLQQWLGGA